MIREKLAEALRDVADYLDTPDAPEPVDVVVKLDLDAYRESMNRAVLFELARIARDN